MRSLTCRPWLFAAVAFLAPAVIYLGWLPQSYSGDDLQQSMSIQQSVTGVPYYHPAGGRTYEPGLTEHVDEALKGIPLNPRYVLEPPTARLVTLVWNAAGWKGGVITPVETYHAVAGALGVLFVFLALVELRKNVPAALLASAGLGFGVAYWTYSTHVDQSITMVMLLCLAFYVLVRQRPRVGLRGGALLAVVLVLASLYNFTAVLSTAAFGVAVASMGRPARMRDQVRVFLTFCGFCGLACVAVIVLAVTIGSSPASLSEPDYWRRVMFAGRPEFGFDGLRDVLRAALGFAKSQVAYFGVPGSLQEYWSNSSTPARARLLVFFGCVLSVMAAPAFGLLARRRQLPSDERWLWMVLAAWFALHAAFNLFWDPGFVKYWLPNLVPAWIVLGLFLAEVRGIMKKRYVFALVAATLVVGFMCVENLTTEILPASRRDSGDWRAIAQTLADTPPSALFVSDGHTLEFYIAYFSRRDIVSTALIEYASGGDSNTVKKILGDHVRRHRRDGGDVYVFSAHPGGVAALARAIGLPAAGHVEPRWTFSRVTIYRAKFDTDIP